MKNVEIGLFLVRVVVGLIFFLHGLDKFQNGLEYIAIHFDSIGLPGFLGYIVAVIELVGGLAVIIGIGTRFVSSLFAILMAGAIVKVKLSAGFVGGYEFDLILLVTSILLSLNGSQLFSVDRMFTQNKGTFIQG